MSEQKKFNLLRFVYGELFINSINKTVAAITVDTWKYYSWRSILNWLTANKHIYALKVERVSVSQCRISYIFNNSNIIYPAYIHYLQRLQG